MYRQQNPPHTPRVSSEASPQAPAVPSPHYHNAASQERCKTQIHRRIIPGFPPCLPTSIHMLTGPGVADFSYLEPHPVSGSNINAQRQTR